MKLNCSVCGKEIEVQDGTWAAQHPDRAKCHECFEKGGKDKNEATKLAKGSTYKPAAAKAQITAEVLRQSYDEVVAAFADVLDDVKDYLGGWTTTIALSKK